MIFLGAMLGFLLGSLPRIFARLGDHPNAGLAAVIAGPTAMMALMVPRLYESLEHHTFEHFFYHLGMAAFGVITGLGATRLGVVAGRLTLALAVAMPILFAAAVK
jgi:hypothetical protein